MNARPRGGLRWYQYSLRSLFVLTLLVAIAGSWFAVKKRQVERQRAAVVAIEKVEGVNRVAYDYQFGASGGINPNPQPPGPALLRAWLGDDFFAHVTFVQFEGPSVTDPVLEHVRSLPQLTTIVFTNVAVTDDGLKHLEGLSQLQSVALMGTGVTNERLVHLQTLDKLTDLALFDARVDDVGLEHLTRLTRLRKLRLRNTKVTDEGVQRLQQALPNCKITR